MFKFGINLLGDGEDPIDLIVGGDDDEGTTIPTPGNWPHGNNKKVFVSRGFKGSEPIDGPVVMQP